MYKTLEIYDVQDPGDMMYKTLEIYDVQDTGDI